MTPDYSIRIDGVQAQLFHTAGARHLRRRYLSPMRTERTFYLREWRLHRDLTQEELAERADMSPSHLANVETGRKRYNEDILESLAKALGCEVWELIGRNPLKQPAEIVDIWNHISPADKPSAIRALKGFVQETPKKKA